MQRYKISQRKNAFVGKIRISNLKHPMNSVNFAYINVIGSNVEAFLKTIQMCLKAIPYRLLGMAFKV